jgi:hypothetical protein
MLVFWPLFSVTTTHHGPRSCWNSSASPSPHYTPPLLASARLNKHPQLSLDQSPHCSLHTLSVRSSTAAEVCSSGVTSRQKRHEKPPTSASFPAARFCDVLIIGSPKPVIRPPALQSARQWVHSSPTFSSCFLAVDCLLINVGVLVQTSLGKLQRPRIALHCISSRATAY